VFCQRTITAFDGHPALVSDPSQRLPHHRPAHAPIPDIDELAFPVRVRWVQGEIFHVHFGEEIAQDKDPFLRRGILHVVADVEVGLHPAALEGGDELSKQRRFDPEIVPDVLEGDDHPALFGKRDQFPNRFPGGVNGMVVRLDIVAIRRVVADRDPVHVPAFRVKLDDKLPSRTASAPNA
jgi:hypothetical protein